MDNSQVFNLKGFEIKRVKCVEKGCKKNIKPIKIKCRLEVDMKNISFRIVYSMEDLEKNGNPSLMHMFPELVGIKDVEMFNTPFPSSMRKLILRKMINKLRFSYPEKLMCEGHYTLKKLIK